MTNQVIFPVTDVPSAEAYLEAFTDLLVSGMEAPR